MAIPEVSVCSPWAEIGDVCSPCNPYELPTPLLEQMLVVASEALFNLTGRLWTGACVDTIRPCSARSLQVQPGAWQTWSGQQVVASGYAAQWGVCGCGDDLGCGCSSVSTITLPRTPVTGIRSVKIDGVVLPAARYRLIDFRHLVYVPESPSAVRQGWPCCQDLTLDTDQVDTFEIVYGHGTPPPMGGVTAAASLGCQLTLGATDSSACRLPKRIQTVTRQGVTIGIVDDLMALLSAGATGLYDVDLFLASVRWGQAHAPAAVYNPDRWRSGRARRDT